MEKTAQRSPELSTSTDRLSTLPDDILCSILAYLPTIRSVQTSVLARRWRSLWAYVPSLDYQNTLYEDPQLFINHSDNINKFMLSHKSKELNTFKISDISCTCNELETWIAIAILGNVRNLFLSSTSFVVVPQCLFTCKTLVELNLCGVCIPSFGDLVSLPRLKKLHLQWVKYSVDDPLPNLLFGCPVLEELAFYETWHEVINRKDYSISSPTIKSLVVAFGKNGCLYNLNYMLKINASTLKYLRERDCCYQHIMLSQETMTSLAEAIIIMDKYDYCKKDKFAVKFLESLSNVKCLTLVGYFEKIDIKIRSNVKFNNLTTLKMLYPVRWRSLVNLMEIADNLEILKLSSVMYWVEPAQVPACMISNLKSISFDHVACTHHEWFNVVKYFLMNAKVLEKMEICSLWGESYMNISDAALVISGFERGSNQCQVIITTDGVVYVV